MCGIAGIASPSGLRESDPILLDRMLRAISHRGPDDQYTLGEPKAILGTRRLSIIDLEGGRQPLTDESGLVIATQNGEIYNYIELRKDLEQRGHAFRTQGDTEAIVHCYEEYGHGLRPAPAGHVRHRHLGRPPGRLILARDRLGKKPLYWRLAGRAAGGTVQS